MNSALDHMETKEPYRTFRGLPTDFHEAYFRWHVSGQYEGVPEFASVADVIARPPTRERDDWYEAEIEVIDRHYVRLATAKVLEIGCGDGNLTWKLAGRCGQLVSCDVDPRATELSRMRVSRLGIKHNVDFQTRDGAEYGPDERGLYDVVFFVQVLEHVPHWDQGGLFDKVFDLVAPGGCLFVSTPNRWNPRDSHDTGKLLIHWLPRSLRVPLARTLNWSIRGHDPCWPYPPVLHDYVSFAWMLRRARRACPNVKVSSATFYPTVNDWFAARYRNGLPRKKQVGLQLARLLGRWLSLNYYLGDKVIFAKPNSP